MIWISGHGEDFCLEMKITASKLIKVKLSSRGKLENQYNAQFKKNINC